MKKNPENYWSVLFPLQKQTVCIQEVDTFIKLVDIMMVGIFVQKIILLQKVYSKTKHEFEQLFFPSPAIYSTTTNRSKFVTQVMPIGTNLHTSTLQVL